MASKIDTDYRLQQQVRILDASMPTPTIECINNDGARVPVELDWRNDTCPNIDAPHPVFPRRGQLKPEVTSEPRTGAFGELYVAMAVCKANNLPPGKYPIENPIPTNFTKTKFRPLSLKLKVLLENGKPSKDIELLLPENADLKDGILLLVDGEAGHRVSVTLNLDRVKADLS